LRKKSLLSQYYFSTATSAAKLSHPLLTSAALLTHDEMYEAVKAGF